MDILSRFGNAFADARLGANLVAVHGMITVTVIASLLLRRVIIRGGSGLGDRTGLPWLEAAGEEAVRRARSLLFWLTLGALFLTVVAGIGYHFVGRDIRNDLAESYQQLTVAELLHAGLSFGALLAVLLAAWFAVRLVRRVWPFLEAQVKARVGHSAHEETLRRWFVLLRFYAILAIRLAAVWTVCKVVGLGAMADSVIGFTLRVLTILVLARLLTLSAGVLSRTLAQVGDRYLGNGPLQHYWERVGRLFPFGERCFEAAVYVTATSQCLGELYFIAAVAAFDRQHEYGPKIVKCIGIFFMTRVLIELLQVLLNEAFGLYKDEETLDQKARTLVPLLYSVGQYVIYFGSGLVMLEVFKINSLPFLAGASILGLAVGLGAQSLVTDVVSGFFILFEGQYFVGDYVQINEAAGTVEAVGIRVTHIRDGQGKVHIIPNGQIKGVVSYSKGYVNAVVDHRVPAGSDIEGVFRAMAEAGRRLRQAHHEVLAETQIHGLVELGTTEMTVRAVTKVRPGTHGAMQNEYRRLLKQVFDQNTSVTNRPTVAA